MYMQYQCVTHIAGPLCSIYASYTCHFLNELRRFMKLSKEQPEAFVTTTTTTTTTLIV